MKIGIMTVPFNNNYGGFLQAYALKHILVEMGHEVIFIIRKRNRENLIRNLFAYLIGRRGECLLLSEYKTKRISKFTAIFINKYLRPFTRNYYSTPDFEECDKMGIDVYIAGSDQCWRSKYAEGYIDDYFFKFLKGSNKKRISYAASFGTKDFEYSTEMQKSCSELLKEFSSISVREKSGIHLLENYFNVPVGFAKVVLDPTMLLSIDDYKHLFSDVSGLSRKYLFTYILDSNSSSDSITSNIKKKLGVPAVNMKAQTGDISDLKYIEPVETWLSRIYYSSFVCTDSFHGTVFSILFNRPFVVILNEGRGSSRIESLLSTYGLCDRIVSSKEEQYLGIIDKGINWDNVNTIINSQRNESIKYLMQALQND